VEPIVQRLEAAGFVICRSTRGTVELPAVDVATAAAALAAAFRNDVVLPHEEGDE
jgi:hypothetical protein